MTHKEIQEDIISRYRIDLCDGTKCKNDWSRVHAHIRERRVCKWHQADSFASTFTLLHEVGHIETTTSKMRRAESEYYATTWALDRCREYGLKINEKTLLQYQCYILMEIARGKRRGGEDYAEMNLYKHIGRSTTIDEIYTMMSPRWRMAIG